MLELILHFVRENHEQIVRDLVVKATSKSHEENGMSIRFINVENQCFIQMA